MPSQIPPFGVSQVYLGLPDETKSVPVMTGETVTLAAKAPSKFSKYTGRAKLVADDYDVVVTLVGLDNTNGGYGATASSAVPVSSVTVTSGQGIEVTVDTTAITDAENAIAALLWIRRGSAPFKAVDWAFIDPAVGISHLIVTDASDNAPEQTAAQLTGTADTDVLGDKDNIIGVDYKRIRTQGGVRKLASTEGFTASPDDARDFPVTVTRSTDIAFRMFGTGLEELALALGGDFVEFTNANGDVIEQLARDVYEIVSQVPGNSVIKTVDPRQRKGLNISRRRTTLYFGNLTNNSQDSQIDEQKLQASGVDFELRSASLDTLVGGMANTITYSNG